jgi:hypothetical protein
MIAGYIYILQRDDGVILAARTLKNRLITFINHGCEIPREELEKTHKVRRFPNNPFHSSYTYQWEELQ